MATRSTSKFGASRSELARSAQADPRPDNANDRSDERDNQFKFDITKSGPLSRDLGPGDDQVEIKGDVQQIRITFTSVEVGNGNPDDSNTMRNQDGGLAVRVQAEDDAGNLTGPVSRFDDEGITFSTKGDATFDVRDLVSGVERGNFFDVVILGTSGADTFDETGSSEAYYINAGMGNDTLIGGLARDFLVGGGGNDSLNGREGNDSFIGGGGNDVIVGGTGDDRAIMNISLDGSDQTDLGAGDDNVIFAAPAGGQIRLTFTSADVGNGNPLDGNNASGEDGGLAVRVQLEGAGDTLTGPISRTDDEGITCTTVGDAKFDVRDLPSGTQRGNMFDVVELGTSGDDTIDETGESELYYINAGGGNDTVTGGLAADFLVGGAGNDRLNGREGNDSLIGGGGADLFIFTGGPGTGGPGNDRILDFMSGTDKLDLRAYGITSANVSSALVAGNTVVSVDSNRDGTFDFDITLAGVVTSPPPGDFLF